MKILVVEDDRIVGQYVKRGLEEQSYHADLVDDGMEALRLISGGHYDMVILDLRLPGMTGFEVLRTVRDRGLTIPILVLTAQDAATRVQATQPLREYLVRLLAQTRADERVELGASPRAGLMLLRAAKARAMLYGRAHVEPGDVQALAQPVLAHRLVLAPEAVGVGPAQVIADAVAAVPAL